MRLRRSYGVEGRPVANASLDQKLDVILERLDDMGRRLDIMEVNWRRTLTTWVRLERQGQERERRLDSSKKNLKRPYLNLIHSDMK